MNHKAQIAADKLIGNATLPINLTGKNVGSRAWG